ncbi:sigma-70 RNA polymerase sigma factor region 4 domain-containing protein [Methanosarcina mazei]|uniref:Uncharacterized protein n=2 Tax=Methanosarcina mazei TaxID=2209 RepID=A0A0F8LCQ1_METMZ|nr:transcriptional regulator [Methanosarcina mazei]KKG51865.1 hypothetical protein DU33_11820 [Methanosarcina mazei]KKG57943.1 hypothetical protein DU64_12840 [Methanosarcina mazei]KKG58254.1 hypothetical protein DU45_12100 [Methanosarcina mazei]KKG97928.1 hypothetical protein DU56_11580 [Methanosarcina mazei]KKG98260.1 hypothetical protein DU68_09745 [Methanosarcina mazei]
MMASEVEKVVYEPEGFEELENKNFWVDCAPELDTQKCEEFSSIEEVIEYSTRNNKIFKSIFNGKYNNSKYPTPRDAEKALIECLVLYTQNQDWILEILNKSTLKRTKWDENSYLQNLVHEVLSLKDDHPVKQTKLEGNQDVNQDINEDVDLDELGFPEETLDQAETKALRILATGDPIDYVLETVEEMHVGDKNMQEGIGISIASQSCSNTDGIQISVNGKSGTGKSDAMKKHTHLLPARYKRVTNVSSKALYYMNLRPGMVLFFDDKDPDPALEEVFKRCTTNYQGFTVYNTVKDQGRLQLVIPPRINWYFTSVESHVTAQMLNRQLLFDSDTSSVQDQSVFDLQKKNAKVGKSSIEVNMKVLICRRIYAHIKDQLFRVKIPFADRIELKMINDRRVFPLLLDMIKGYTIFKYQQRSVDEEGCLIADLEDFYRAKRLFEAKAESVITHLNENERKIIRYIMENQGSNGCTYDEIAKGTEIPYKTVQRIINGRKDREESGLIEKYNGLEKIDYTESKLEQETKCDPETGYESLINKGSTSRRVTRLKINTENVNPWEVFDDGFVYLKEQ